MVRESLKKNEIYLLTKYIKSVLWGVAVRLSYIQDAWCLKVNPNFFVIIQSMIFYFLKFCLILTKSPKQSGCPAEACYPPLSHQNLLHVLIIIVLCVTVQNIMYRSQWPRGLRRRSAAARLLRLWVRIPRGCLGYLSAVRVVCCQAEVSATS